MAVKIQGDLGSGGKPITPEEIVVAYGLTKHDIAVVNRILKDRPGPVRRENTQNAMERKKQSR